MLRLGIYGEALSMTWLMVSSDKFSSDYEEVKTRQYFDKTASTRVQVRKIHLIARPIARPLGLHYNHYVSPPIRLSVTS